MEAKLWVETLLIDALMEMQLWANGLNGIKHSINLWQWNETYDLIWNEQVGFVIDLLEKKLPLFLWLVLLKNNIHFINI